MDPFEKLANAIIVVAVYDYQRALQRQQHHPCEDTDREIAVLERFFRSSWYALLTNVDCEYLMERVRSQTGRHTIIRQPSF